MQTRKIEPPIIATLIGDAAPHSERVWRGTVFSQYGGASAYIKLLSARRLLVECVAATLGRAHDLPIPQPYIVWTESHQLPGCPDYSGWMFACEDARQFSLARLVREREESERLIRSWKRASEAGAFDSWIANADRTSKNLLWADDSRRIQLIDHEDAMPGWLAVGGETANEIMRILCHECDEHSQRRHHRNALRSTEHFGASDWSAATAWARNICDEDELLAIVAFIMDRLQHLPDLISKAAGRGGQLSIWQTTSHP